MKIEILFPEIYIYGDIFNVHYLEKCLPKASFIYTSLNEEPSFNKEKIDMIYIGSFPDYLTKEVVNRLIKYKNKIKKMIEEDKVFLVTGNAISLFGKDITIDKRITCLDIFPYQSEHSYEKRVNSWFKGSFKNIEIIGNKSQFSHICEEKVSYPFIKIINGYGINHDNQFEGINYKNFFGTELLGPFLIMNPLFSEYFFKNILKVKDKIKYKDELLNAYYSRLEKLKDPLSINYEETVIIRRQEK